MELTSTLTFKDQGNIGEAAAIYWYTSQGYVVSKPLTENQPYDLIIEGDELLRISVKTTRYRTPSGGWKPMLRTAGGNQSFYSAKPFNHERVDRLFVVCGDGAWYDIPTSAFKDKSFITLGSPQSKLEDYLVKPAGQGL